MDVSARWAELMRRPERDLPLDEAALLIAARANPALDVAAQLARLDDVAGSLGAVDSTALCGDLFGRLGLRGDRDTYDDPRNSYLDQVLDRQLGIPISLSVLLIEIGRRCGLALEGVGMPGHFLVRDPATPELLINAFDAGRRLSRSDCEDLLYAATGTRRPLTEAMLTRAGPRAILARMLANLDRSFERRGDGDSLLWVCRLRRELPALPLGDRLQLAGRLGSLGRFDEAADLVDELATVHEGGDVGTRLRGEATGLRARLN